MSPATERILLIIGFILFVAIVTGILVYLSRNIRKIEGGSSPEWPVPPQRPLWGDQH